MDHNHRLTTRSIYHYMFVNVCFVRRYLNDAPCDLKFVTNIVFYHTRAYDFTILRLSYLLAYLETAASPRGQTPQ